MQLSDVQLQMLETACNRLGKVELARRLGITRQAIYDVLKRKSGLNPVALLKIQELLIETKSREMPGNGPSASMETTQADTRSDTAEELQLLSKWLQGLSKDELAKVIAFVVGLREKQGNN